MYTEYDGNSKESRWACYEKVVHFGMDQGQDLKDYTINLMEMGGQLHEMGENISVKSFEDTLLQGLTDDYDFVKMTSFHCPDFGINDI